MGRKDVKSKMVYTTYFAKIKTLPKKHSAHQYCFMAAARLGGYQLSETCLSADLAGSVGTVRRVVKETQRYALPPKRVGLYASPIFL